MGSAAHPFETALRLHQAGQAAQAIPLYERLLVDQPGHAGAWHLLGVARQQQGRREEAVRCIGRALGLDPSKAVYHNNFGVALRALGRLAEARQALARAVARQPAYADAHSNLGLVLRDQGDREGAVACFRRALELAPEHRDALFNLANALLDLGRREEAIGLYRRVVSRNPRHAGAWNNLGNALLAERRAGEAVAAYKEALALEPRFAEASLNLGMALAEQENLQEAAEAFARAADVRPDQPLWRLRHLSLCPTVFQSAEEIEHYRAGLEAELDDARRAPIRTDEATFALDGFCPSFNLAHHGRSNRGLLEKFAALFRPHVRKREVRPRGGKPRVGFLVTAPHAGSFLRTMGGIVERLAPERFTAVVLAPQGALGALRKGLRREDLEWVTFPDHFSAAADRIAAAGCEVLYHHKVSADPLGYLLPFARLAPVQCTSWATHFTSGVSEVDYYLSSALVEANGADVEYTETLVRLATLPLYERPPTELRPAKRSDFNLPERGGLYLCPQRLAKFHPAQDELLRGVLDADPEGHLVLLAGRSQTALAQLLGRFAKTLGKASERVIVLLEQAPEDFRRLLAVGDALLDIHHYSASLMTFDAFSADLPIVTLPGRFKVERYAQGFYRRLGIKGPVASSPEEYVRLAVRLGTDPDYRRAVGAEIAARKHLLFEDPQTVREYERFLEEALRRSAYASAPPGPTDVGHH